MYFLNYKSTLCTYEIKYTILCNDVLETDLEQLCVPVLKNIKLYKTSTIDLSSIIDHSSIDCDLSVRLVEFGSVEKDEKIYSGVNGHICHHPANSIIPLLCTSTKII